MIRYQITGKSPVEINTAAKLLLDHPRLDIDHDSGNLNGRTEGYIRHIEALVKRRPVGRPRQPRLRLDGADKLRLAGLCWDKILHKTDTDPEAVQAIVDLIEYLERKMR